MTDSMTAVVFYGVLAAVLSCFIGGSWYYSTWWPIGILVGGIIVLYLWMAVFMGGFKFR